MSIPTQLNATDLSDFLGVTLVTINRWKNRGLITPVIDGHQKIYRLADVRRAIAQHNLAVAATDSDWPEEPTA